MEKSKAKFNNKIFIVLSMGIFLSIFGQIAFLIYLLTNKISLTLPIKWYVWLAIILSSEWILYFGVICLEPNNKMRSAFSILGLCVLLIYINAWFLLGTPVLWIIGIVAIIILLTAAWYFFQRAKYADQKVDE